MKNFHFRFSVKLLLLLFFYSFNSKVYASVYYVSSSKGDDGRSPREAQDASTPWRSLGRVNAAMGVLRAGDQVLFKRGEVFFGSLTVTVSGSAGSPIVFGAYGEGPLPELTGFVLLSGWQSKGGGVWEAVVPGGLSYLNTVTVDGAAKASGRWPNAGAANQGYLNYDSYSGNTSVTDGRLAGRDWTGGEVVVRKTRWVLDRGLVTSQSGGTLNYVPQSGYGASKGYGYFVRNHPGTLDLPGEWYYRAEGKKLGVFTGGGAPDAWQVRAGTVETLVRVANQSNLSFEGLRLSGATVSAFEVSSSQGVRIGGCEVLFSGKNGVNANNTDGLTVENTTIAHTNNNACTANNCTNTAIRGNQVRATGMEAGMGEGGDGTYEGVLISGDNNSVTNNVIDSTGYIPLTFSGDNVTVKDNLISNFAVVKDDGGGIYTWNNGPGAAANKGRAIVGNIVLNGVGAPGGTDGPDKRFAHGIYIDDNAGQVEITGNTVSGCAMFGVYVHNAHNIAIKQNTLYDNATQLFMEHDNIAPNSPVYGCVVTGNVLFAKQAGQMAAEYKTKDNDIANFGTFDQNWYYRPLDDDLTIGVLQQVNGAYGYQTMGLEGWKALYGKDAGSVKAAHKVPAYTVTKVTGGNQFANGTFDGNANGQYVYASAGNCSTGWDSGALDGGSLKVSFSSTTNGAAYGSVVMGIGAVAAGRQYRLKFSMLGGNVHKAVTAYLRQSGGGYADLSARKAATVTGGRQEKGFLFTATANESDASVVFDVPEQPSPLYLDNVKLEAVEATPTNPGQYVSFFYNPTTSGKSFGTNGQSYDAAGNSYPNSVKLEPFASAVLVQDTAVDCLVPLAKPVIVANE